LGLAVVRDLRDRRAPATAEELADFEVDVLAGFVLARASAGLADGIATRRITIGGISRPLDELTAHALLDWLAYRRERWPGTANPHLLVSSTSALGHRPVSHTWILNLRGLPGTLERLRIDRQLEEAITAGADPLHLAAVFGFSEGTAIRWATNARQLLTSPRAVQ
jgi:hypothetical protein